jgi:HK97 family phage portal protein
MGILQKIFNLAFGNGEKTLNSVPTQGGWYPVISEAFTGAWQRNIEEVRGTVLTYPALYACIARIAQDIGKLPFVLKETDSNGISKTVANTAYSPVLRKPTHYQTQSQFRESWILSKLTFGNTYVLKQRDNRGVVTSMYILNPMRVKPLVSDSGDVFYELQTDNISLIPNSEDNLIVPASEIIHDREITLHHPLIGVPPVAAANWAAVKNLRILKSSAEFFANGASPGGILTAPGSISDETATRLSTYWNENFTGDNAGRVAVVGDNLKYEQLSANAADSQLVEQMRYSDEQICQPFGIPPFIIGIGTIPAGMKIDDMTNMYYSFALQTRIEHMENLLDEGLAVSKPYGIELDLEPLLRMDAQKMAEVQGSLIKNYISTPNEARSKFGLAPIEGGNTIYIQQQNYSIQALSKRDSQDPFKTESTEPVDDEVIDEEKAMLKFGLLLRHELKGINLDA